MSAFFFDSSALVKRYLVEVGTAWVRHLADPGAGDTVIVGQITRVEAAAAIAAGHRAGTITLDERDAGVALVLRHFDAVQLAAALDANTTIIAAGLLTLTFVAADDDLLAAARAEGLAAESPNQHP